MLALGAACSAGVEDDTLDGGTRGLGWPHRADRSRACATLQTGYARNYALAIFLGAALILLSYFIDL